MKITLIVPQVKIQPEGRPKRCPKCGSHYLARHGAVAKALKDIKLNQVQAVRYRCSGCGVTFRHYPEGVRRSRQSKRVVILAALMQALGLSCSVTSHLLRLEDAPISKTTVWRDVQEVGIALRRHSWTGKARVTCGRMAIGADETWVKVKGQKVALGFVVDAQSGETIWVEVLLELDSAAFLRWLRKIAARVGAEVLVTDDLSTYKPVAERLGLKHQVCLAHVRKNISKRLKKLPGQEAVKEAVKEIIKELPPWGERAFRELAKVLRRDTPWRMFLRELADKYKSLRLHLEEEGVPATNNVTERAIGRSKVRYKTLRGFKSEAGMLNMVALTQWLYTPNEVHDTRGLIA